MAVQKPRIKMFTPTSFVDTKNMALYDHLLFSENPLDVVSFCDITFDACKFEKIDFHLLDLKNVFFCDCIFEHIDCSNIEFYKSNFTRCQFIDCKMIGTSFIDSTLVDVVFHSSLIRYGNFSNCKFQHISLAKTDCSQASFHYLDVKDLVISESCLDSAEFLETSLNQVDLSDSSISGIVTDLKSLKGVKVSFEQAASLAQILGITIV